MPEWINEADVIRGLMAYIREETGHDSVTLLLSEIEEAKPVAVYHGDVPCITIKIRED